MNSPRLPVRAGRRPLRRASQLLPLEQRFMFDAAVADAAHLAQSHDSAVPAAVLVRAAEPAKDDGKKEVVLVDTSLANYKSLEAQVRDGVGIVEFDGSQDGLAQIAQWAASEGGYDAIHILSHGAEGVLNLGTTSLNAESLGSSTVQAELAQLGQALTSDGDLLLYGCDLAAGDDGSTLLAGLAQATGADVAASTNLTGAASLGGDWTLEAHAGVIEARELTLSQYDGVLASAPSTPSTPLLDSASDTGPSSSDGVTNDNTPTFTGSADSGSTVTVYIDGKAVGTTVASNGVWSYTSTTLTDGIHSITTTATDASGAVSASSGALSITIDTVLYQVTSVVVPANATYYAGQTLEFTVNFNDVMYVDTSGGTPRLAVTIGSIARQATYVSGSGSSALVFSYTVTASDTDTNGVTLGSLSSGGGKLSDLAGNSGSTTVRNAGSTAAVLVDGTRLGVASINASTANGDYSVGATITVTVNFSSAVDVDTSGGVPTLTLSSGGSATYTGGSGSSTLTFTYTVRAGDNSADLDYSSSSALALNGASITASAGSHLAVGLSLATPGATGSLGANRDIVIDTTPPAITGGSVSFDHDSGSSSTDHVFNQPVQSISGTLTGTLGAGETVQVSLDNGLHWLLASANGANWSIGSQTLSGSNTLLVRVVDAAGNIGTVAGFAYVLDTTAPSTSFSNIALSNDSGISNTDLITNIASQTISATLSAALDSGDRVYGSLDGGITYTDITSKVSGTTLHWDGVTLSGANRLMLMVVDAAGNAGVASSQAYRLDTSAPLTSNTGVGFSNDRGSSASDLITNAAAQTISGTLSANLQADETVYVSLDNGVTWQAASAAVGDNHWTLAGQTLSASNTLQVKVSDTAGNDGVVYRVDYVYDITPPAAASVDPLETTSVTPVLSGTATLEPGASLSVTVGGATYDVTPINGVWTLDLSSAVPASGTLTLARDHQYDVQTTVTDIAGNSSHDATSGELVIVTPPPPTTTIGDTTLSADSGVSDSDFITNVAHQTISGSLSAPLQNGERVEISLDGGASWSNASVSDRSWTFGATLSGSGTLQVRVSGEGGSGPAYSHSYALDTTPPATPSADAQTSSSLTPVLSGSAALADGETMLVSVGGADYAVSVTDGHWSLDLPSATAVSGSLTLAPGHDYNVTLTVTDLAGNTTTASGELHIAPLPVVTGLSLSADSGASNSDFITNVANQTLNGTLSAPLADGQTVEVSTDGGLSWHNATASGSNWSASVTLDGSNTLQARVTIAGNSSTVFKQDYVLDTTPPATPSADAQTSSSLTPILSGSAALADGETLQVSVGGADYAVSMTDGHWSLDLSSATAISGSLTLAPGHDYNVTLTVTDLAGNTTTASGELHIAPLPVVTGLHLSADSGASNSDFITNVANQTLSGTLSAPLADGQTVEVSTDGGQSWHNATASGSNWSASVTLDGSNTLQARVTIAGNSSTVFKQDYVLDTTPPATPSADTQTSSSLTPILSGSAALADGETMLVSVGGADYAVSVTDGHWSLDLSSATAVSGSLTLAPGHDYNVTLTVTDLAGNTTIASGELHIAPLPVVTGLNLSADSGASSSDFITNVANQTLSGTLSAPLADGQTVEVSTDGGLSWHNATASGSNWSANVTLDGSNTLQARVTIAGNSSTVFKQDYVLDTTPPATPSADAQTSSSLTPILSGSAALADGETLQVSVGGADYAVSVTDGHWSLDLSSATAVSGSLTLAPGHDYNVTLTVTDLAGNTTTASGALHIAPLPLVTGLNLSADSGASNSDFITNVANQTLSGTLSAPLADGQTVEVSTDGGQSWHNATASGSNWSASVTLDGSNTLQARVTIAGNSSTVFKQDYVLDTTAPLATPTLPTQQDGTVSGSLSVPLGAGETLLASLDGGATWNVISTSGMNWSVASNGASSVQLVVRDIAGNNGATLAVDIVVTPEQPSQPDQPEQPEQPEQPQQPEPPSPQVPPAKPVQPLSPVVTLPPESSADRNPLDDDDFAPVTTPHARPSSQYVLPWASTNGDFASEWPDTRPQTLPDQISPAQPERDNYRIATRPDVATLSAYQTIPDAQASEGEPIAIQLPGDAFAHADDNGYVELSALSADGSPLPPWIHFDARTGRFEGTPPAGYHGTLNLQLIARDAQGHTATQTFSIVIGKDTSNASQATGRASLGEQMRSARNASAARLAGLSS